MPRLHSSSSFTGIPYLAHELAQRHLPIDKVVETMYNTSMVLGGGFALNQLLHMTGRHFPITPENDIDFFVYGGVCSMRDINNSTIDHCSRSNKERSFRTMVILQFNALVEPCGYIEINDPMTKYMEEKSEEGDRIFTTGSDIRLKVLTFGRYEHGVISQKLNLIFSDTPIHEVIRKVDITLTAGYIYANNTHIDGLGYKHCHPEHVNELKLRWSQEDSTHTPRQLARWQKYTERYNILEEVEMSVGDFILGFDTLPDSLRITLVGTPDQLASQAVTRRIAGLPKSQFIMSATMPPIRIRIPSSCDINQEKWRRLDPGAPRHRIIKPEEEDEEDEEESSPMIFRVRQDISVISPVHTF